MKFTNETLIDVYTPYHSIIYLPSNMKDEGDYIIKVSEDTKDPSYEAVPFRVINAVNRETEMFKTRMIRFRPDEEEEVWKELRIDKARVRDVYTKEEIDRMILTPTDEDLSNILKIKSYTMINLFFKELIWLRNSGKYWVSEKADLYIRARREEIQEGITHSELEVIESPDEEEVREFLGIEDETEEVEEVEEVVEEKKEEVKPKTTAKKTTTKSTTKKTTK